MDRSRIQEVFLLVIFVITSLQVHCQSNALEFRFINGFLDQENNTYAIDIEVLSNQEKTSLHAMNARFFYQASILEFQSFSDFKSGYGFVSGLEKTNIGGKGSAKKMFSLSGQAGYVNQGIAQIDAERVDWKQGEWQKLVRVYFKVLDSSSTKTLCPSFIWDKNIDQELGGYLKGSMGMSASTISNIGGEMKCNSAICELTDYQWARKSKSPPFGIAELNECINQDLKTIDELDAELLMQNQPNPFADLTYIEFFIPKKESVTFSIYKENGVLIHEFTETYSPGNHTITINRDITPISGTYMYKIETENFVSDYKKMIKFE